LGGNGLLLGPIFSSSSQGYDTVDYFQIDQRLGDDADFDALVAACRDRGVRLLLGGVFNHVGRDFAPVAQALAERPGSEAEDCVEGAVAVYALAFRTGAGISAGDRATPPQPLAGRRDDPTEQVDNARILIRARARHGEHSLALILNLAGEPFALTDSAAVLEAEPDVADRAVAPHGWAVVADQSQGRVESRKETLTDPPSRNRATRPGRAPSGDRHSCFAGRCPRGVRDSHRRKLSTIGTTERQSCSMVEFLVGWVF
jgi:hypothetical protein